MHLLAGTHVRATIVVIDDRLYMLSGSLSAQHTAAQRSPRHTFDIYNSAKQGYNSKHRIQQRLHHTRGGTGSTMATLSQLDAATLRVQNMIKLCKELRLPVSYKVCAQTTTVTARILHPLIQVA